MRYERLTIVAPNGECRVAETKFNSDKAKQKAVNRLAELEDKIEDGTLVELPCKVGDKIYEPVMVFGKSEIRHTIKIHTITSINIFEDEIYFMDDTDYDWTAEQFGVIGFLTKAEAEKRLEELRGEV